MLIAAPSKVVLPKRSALPKRSSLPKRSLRRNTPFDPFQALGATAYGAWTSGRNVRMLNATQSSGWGPQAGTLAWDFSDSGLRPDASASTGPNSRPGLTFIRAQSDALNEALSVSLPQPHHIFIVGRYTAVAATGTLVGGKTVTATSRIFRTGNSQMSISSGTTVNSSPTPDLTQPRLFEALFSGAGSYFKLDGTQLAAGDAGSGASSTGLFFGSSAGAGDTADCVISEVWIFSAELTGANLTNFKQGYLAPWYALTLV